MAEASPQPGVAYQLGRQQRRARAAGAAGAAGSQQGQPVQVQVAAPDELTEQTARARLADLAARHEILRSQIIVPPGLVDPVQLVTDDPTVSLAVAAGPDGAPLLTLTADALIADATTLARVADLVATGAADVDDPIQFAEYAQWQDELAAETPDGADAFWATCAEPSWTHVPAALLDTANADATTADTAALVAIAGASRARALALLACAVGRLSGEDDVWLGVEVDARRGEELEGAAGPYSEVLPVLVTVTESLASVEQACAHVLEQLEAFQEWAPDAMPYAAPVVLGLGPATASVPRPGLEVELRTSSDGALTLNGVAGAVADLGVALAAFDAADAATPVAAVDIYAGTSLAPGTLAPSTLGTPAGPDAPSIVASVVEHALREPDRLALRLRDRHLTYGQLVASAGALLDGLDGQTGPVAVVADRSPGTVVALLAALASGRGYLPLDPAQPELRLRAVLQDCGCDTVLADVDADLGGVAAIVESGTRLVRVDAGASASEGTGPSTLPTPAPDALAYVIYTSGSTGTPKGVEVTAANLDAYVAGVRAALQLGDAWNWALASSPSTDLGNTAIYAALAAGGTLSILDHEQLLDPVAFGAAMSAHAVDAIKTTPSHLANLLAGADPALPGQLIVLGGEALPWALVDRIRTSSAARIANHYGPTETTVGALVHEVVADEPRFGITVPIGRPLPGVSIAVTTADGAAAPVGAVGELRIAGSGVTRGYRNDPDRTAAVFADDPAGRSYRTGDLVRIGPSGEVEFLGRRDGQVKIRGFRVETGEIESALLTHPGVQRVAVVLSVGDAGPQLSAYLVSHYHPSPDADELRLHLSSRVPDYMIPATFTELDQLPLTANGKLDVSALPAPNTEAGQQLYREPENIVETEIAAIYAELLEHDRVGRDDDFFRLGGHSLLATQAVMRIRQAFAVELPIHLIFLAPTVAALSAEVETMVLAAVDEE